MKTLYFNGTVLDSLDFNTYEALAVDQGLIVAKGSKVYCASILGPDANYVDLEGHTLFPGFNDSHMHLLGYGQSLFQVDLVPADSQESLICLAQNFLEDNHLPEGEWLLGRGWNQDHFDLQVLPSRETLDQISTAHPIFFRRACGHIGVANTTALKLTGIWDMPRQHVEGGQIDLGFDQRPTGILRENAMDLLLNQIPTPSQTVLNSYIEKAQAQLFSGGITSVQSDDLCVFPMTDSPLVLKTFEEMGANGRLKLSVHEQSLMRTLAHFKVQIDQGYTYHKTYGRFTYGPLKILGDGSLGARTAYLSAPYADAPELTGIPMYTQNELNALVATAFDHQIPVAIHGIGDGMIEQALNAIEAGLERLDHTQPTTGTCPRKLRNAIVHCQITNKQQLHRMSDLDVIAMVQPIFLDYDLHMVEDRIGVERAKTTYAFKTMERLGIPTAYGTDCPVEGYHVFKGIQCAVTRQDLKHMPSGGWLPEEAVTIEEALRAYTLGSAFASGEDHLKGALGIGMMADLVILDQNPLHVTPELLSEIQIVATYKSGEQVYSWK